MATKSIKMHAEYNCLKKVNDPEEIKKAKERISNPNMLTGKDAVFALYQLIGMEVDHDEIFAR